MFTAAFQTENVHKSPAYRAISDDVSAAHSSTLFQRGFWNYSSIKLSSEDNEKVSTDEHSEAA